MAPQFSICIPVVSDKYVRNCLDSIFKSRFQDFEVLVNDSSEEYFVSDLISQYDVKIVRKKTKSFESRLVLAMKSSGDRILLLDDTRLISDSLLDKLDSMPEDMIVIGEIDTGRGLLIRLANLDKRAATMDKIRLDPLENKSVIPRMYSRDLMIGSLMSIKASLNPEILGNIVGLDLEIIYYNAFKLSQNIGILSNPEILHYGDETFRSVFKKYYRYGFTQSMLRNTEYSQLASISGRNRSGYPIGSRILSLPLQVIRGVPFLMGYISGGEISS